MNREDLTRAQRLVQLRDLALEAALRRLAEATAAADDAAAVEATARETHDDCTAALARQHAALVDDPADAPMGLARLARADGQFAAAVSGLAAAVAVREATDAEVVEARLAARRAQARRDAMAERADRLRRGIAVAREERESLEAEEGAAAMRKAA